MRHRLAPVAALFVLLCSTSACATVAHGARQNVLISSDPPGAAIFVNGKPGGASTPATLSLPRRRALTLRFEREGYATQEVKLQRRGSRWLWLNLGVCSNPFARQGLNSAEEWPLAILTCFSALTAIDLVSGAAFRVPRRVDVELTPIQPAR